MYVIETGDVEEITDRLNPLALTKCKNNTLYMAMKVVKNSSGKVPGYLTPKKSQSGNDSKFI